MHTPQRSIPIVITKKQLRLMVPYTPQYILRLEKKGTFPRRIKIGTRRVGWFLHEIEEWLAVRAGDREEKLARAITEGLPGDVD
jgi:prophage regulatory protein